MDQPSTSELQDDERDIERDNHPLRANAEVDRRHIRLRR